MRVQRKYQSPSFAVYLSYMKRGRGGEYISKLTYHHTHVLKACVEDIIVFSAAYR